MVIFARLVLCWFVCLVLGEVITSYVCVACFVCWYFVVVYGLMFDLIVWILGFRAVVLFVSCFVFWVVDLCVCVCRLLFCV